MSVRKRACKFREFALSVVKCEGICYNYNNKKVEKCYMKLYFQTRSYVMKKFISIIMVIIMLLSMLTACSFNKTDNDESTRKIVDITGAEVEIPNKVDEVVNLFPFGCQLMIGLGLDEYLVGISDSTIETAWLEVMFPEVKNIKTYPDDVDAEALLAVQPDVVFCSDPEQAQEFRNKGITAITFMYLSIEDFKYTINLMGEILGGKAQEKCNSYIEYLDEKIADVDNSLKDVITEKETIYYINGANDRGFYKTGGANSTTEACTKLSYVDLVTSSLITFPETKADAEAVLATNPQNIIIGGNYQHVLYDEIYAADEWSQISAIKNKCVFKIPMGISAWNRYSLETALLIPWTAAVVYPESYEFDAKKEVIEFYKTFMGYELTEQQAEYMIAGLTPDGKKEIASR